MHIVSLKGMTYSGNTYVVHITSRDGKVTNVAVAGTPCKAVRDAADDFQRLKGNAVDAQNVIKLKMLSNNEFVEIRHA